MIMHKFLIQNYQFSNISMF